MTAWVHAALEEWGRAQRWVACGIDGWPPKSTIGRLMEEGVTGAGIRRFVQHFPEVLTGYPLIVANAIKTLPEELRDAVFGRYVIQSKKHGRPAKVVAACLGIAERTYYDRVSTAKDLLSGRIPQRPEGA